MMTRPTARACTQGQFQRGQVLMLAALFIAGFMFVALGIVRLTLQAQEQLQVQHVADHVADAAGIIAARDLNFKAVTNRAMLANEVVIGQLMGLSSWFSMTSRSIENVSLISAWIPYIGAAMRAISQGVNAVDRSIKRGLRGLIAVQQGILTALEAAQATFHSASWLSTLVTMEDIVRQNNPEYELALLNHATLQSIESVWIKLQTRRSGHQQHVEYIEMVGDSRDNFSTKRSYRWFTTGLIKGNKLGASEIGQSQGKVYWQAIDVIAIQARQKFTNVEMPIGWGGNYLDKPLPRRVRGMAYGGSYKVLPLTSSLASRAAFPMTGGHRVPSQYVLERDAEPAAITIVVRKPENEEEGTPRLWGVGRTQLVYSRPARWWPRVDQATERANLFNALWRRQKAPISALELELLGQQV